MTTALNMHVLAQIANVIQLIMLYTEMHPNMLHIILRIAIFRHQAFSPAQTKGWVKQMCETAAASMIWEPRSAHKKGLASPSWLIHSINAHFQLLFSSIGDLVSHSVMTNYYNRDSIQNSLIQFILVHIICVNISRWIPHKHMKREQRIYFDIYS